MGNVVADLAQVGLLVSKKVFSHALADELDIATDAVPRLVSRLHPARSRARIAEIIDETPSTSTLRLVPVGEPFPPFRAGQYVNIFVNVDGVETSRPYSISSPPSRPYYDITVRQTAGGFVSHFCCGQAVVGTELDVSGPAGSFHREPLIDSDDLVFLAGGSGVTPFMSMIRESADLKSDVRMHLVYGSRSPDDVIFFDELADLACCEDNLKVDIIISEPPEDYAGRCGLLDTPAILSSIGGVEGKTFFLCGPAAMYPVCLGALTELGVPARRIKTELSGPPPDIARVGGWPSTVSVDDEVKVTVEGPGDGKADLPARCGQPLLNSLERGGVVVDNLCRSGECGACRTKLVAGSIFMPASFAMRRADVGFGYVHPCMSYPVSDITIRV
jgi:ferredoxin-NADP reductase/ferredoxin